MPFFGFFVTEHSLPITLNIIFSLTFLGQFLIPVSYKSTFCGVSWGRNGEIVTPTKFLPLMGFVNISVP